MVSISLCMIVKNEEHSLGRCLSSVKDLVDEINIVDTGSTDRTKEVAGLYTDRVFDFVWLDDFAAARNFSFEQATQDYIFWLDADDYLLEKDRADLLLLKTTLSPDYDAVLMDYVLERDVLGSAQNMTRRHRLLKRDRNYRWIHPVHEYIPVKGNVLRTAIEVTHAPFIDKKDRTRNLRILENAIRESGGAKWPRYHFYLAHELMGNGRLEEAEAMFRAFLDGAVENFEDHIAACGFLAHIHHVSGNKNDELQYLHKTFQYAIPRSDYCCRIGLWFQDEGRYDLAIFWYEQALQLKEPDSYNGLINKASWTWAPHVQLAICYGKLGNLDAAYAHNAKAMEYFPEDPILLDNQRRLKEAMDNRETNEAAERNPLSRSRRFDMTTSIIIPTHNGVAISVDVWKAFVKIRIPAVMRSLSWTTHPMTGQRHGCRRNATFEPCGMM